MALSDIHALTSSLDVAIEHLARGGKLRDPDTDTGDCLNDEMSHIEYLQRAGTIIKALRNACATGKQTQGAVAETALPVLRRFLNWDAIAPEGNAGWEASLASARRLTWQCFANMCAGNDSCVGLWWEAVVLGDRRIIEAAIVAARRDALLAGLIAHMIYLCLLGLGGSLNKITATSRFNFLVSVPRLLCDIFSLSTGSPSAAEWLGLLVQLFADAGMTQGLLKASGHGVPLVQLSPPWIGVDFVSAEVGTTNVAVSSDALNEYFTAEMLLLIHLIENADAAEHMLIAFVGSDSAKSRAAAADFRMLAALFLSLCSTSVSLASRAIRPTDSVAAAGSASLMALPAVLAAAGSLADTLSDALVAAESTACISAKAARSDSVITESVMTSDYSVPVASFARSVVCTAVPAALSLLHALTPLMAIPSAQTSATCATAPVPADTSSEPQLISAPLAASIPSGVAPFGLRSSLCRFVALACFRNRDVAATVRNHAIGPGMGRGLAHAGVDKGTTHSSPHVAAGIDGMGISGVSIVLNQCTIDAENPTLREWGLLAVRNLCEALPDVIPGDIERLKEHHTAAAPELQALGVAGKRAE